MTPGGLGVGGEAPHVGHVASSSGGGILGFWASYPNPLARFTGGAVKGTSGGGGASANGLGSGTLTGGLDGPETKAETSAAISGNGTNGTELGGAPATSATSGSVTQVLRRHDEAQRQLRYSLSTVVFVALIAFLIGSLLRSLLSPADFIYVVTDASGSGQHAQEATGWREIRRLLEIKYLVGGWDFQVAVVRRHL
ncbi:hypothetical protein B0H34DRAFT_398611 [Crassisporium funariophilum]|nr:hypothetical protein B0H34DRAFT_398611 [Crassisporium funariophilum]